MQRWGGDMKLDPVHVGTAPPPQGANGRLLAVSVLGHFRANCFGAPVRLRSRKAAAVFWYLLQLRREETETRGAAGREAPLEQVRGTKARASLRQVVHELREALLEVGFLHLQSERAALVLNGLHVSLDMRDVLEQAEKRMRTSTIAEKFAKAFEIATAAGLDDLDPAFRNLVASTSAGFS